MAAAEEFFALPAMSAKHIANPYGDGNAAERIVTKLEQSLADNAGDALRLG